MEEGWGGVEPERCAREKVEGEEGEGWGVIGEIGGVGGVRNKFG